MKNNSAALLVAGGALISAALFASCVQVAGGDATETGNARILGRVVDSEGAGMRNVDVKLLTASYNPLRDGKVPNSLTTQTDGDGRFILRTSSDGVFNIEAANPVSGDRALKSGISIAGHESIVSSDITMRPPGSVRAVLASMPVSDSGYVCLPGTTRFGRVAGGVATIDSVPAGSFSTIWYVNLNDSTGDTALAAGFTVVPGSTAFISAAQSWRFSRKILINTTASGAGVNSNVYSFPVLVRLSSGTFDFSLAQKSGNDIRFTKENGEPLSYEIEQWDSANGRAAIWVNVDTVYGNDSTHSLMMCWGNDTATGTSAGAAVFDTGNGFVGVWHLGDVPVGAASIRDQTANSHHGTPLGDFTSADLVDGRIGKGLLFNGSTDLLHPGQSIQKGSVFTAEAWVSLMQFGNQRFFYDPTGFTLWYDNEMSGLRLELRSKSNTWNGIPQNGGTVYPVTTGQWYHVVGTSDGSKLRLYVNGSLVTVSDSITAPSNPLAATDSLCIGGTTYGEHFKGIMDEARIQGTVRSDGWIKLAFMNQKEQDALIRW